MPAERIAVFCLLFVLALVAAGFGALLLKAGTDDIRNLKDRADSLIAPLVSAAGDREASSGCVFGMAGIGFGGRLYSYTGDCLLECTPTAMCCVTLLNGEPNGRYTFLMDDISLCRVRKHASGYRITVTAHGKKNVFAVNKRSPHGIIPEQSERVEKFIDIFCKATKADRP